jgi:hypothetical protein
MLMSNDLSHYRAYLLDATGEIVGHRRFECSSDEDAQERAKRLFAGRKGELWSGPRKVARFDASVSAGRPHV